MALPNGFLTSDEYFQAAVAFLKSNSWIYEHANTRFVRAGVLQRFPLDYGNYFLHIKNEELNNFPFLHTNCQLDESIICKELREFRDALKSLIPKEAYDEAVQMQSTPLTDFTNKKCHKMNAKKQHEITHLAHCIHTHCQQQDLLIDFGAGLGYLSEMLYNINPRWCILGLEGDEYRVGAAEKRQRQQLPQATRRIVYKHQFIDEDAASHIEKQIKDCNFPKVDLQNNCAIIGLHACADLTITAMRLFFEMLTVRRLIIMPCCYHKMQLDTSSQTQPHTHTFHNFPLSAALKSAVADTDPSDYFNRPFLRLACQQTSARWRECSAEEHLSHGRQMFWRAVADAIIHDETESVVALAKSERHAVLKGDDDAGASFASLTQRYELRSKATAGSEAMPLPWSAEHRRKFNEIVQQHGDWGPQLAEALTCLQTTMQKLCENIVLYDRLCYMNERATASANLQINARYQKILNEKLSPRCYVLIAEKL